MGRAHWPASLVKIVNQGFNETLSLENKASGVRQGCSVSSSRLHISSSHSHMHAYSQYIHTNKKRTKPKNCLFQRIFKGELVRVKVKIVCAKNYLFKKLAPTSSSMLLRPIHNDWGEESAIYITCCSFRGTRFNPQQYWGPQLTVTLVPGYLMPSFGIYSRQTHMWYNTYIQNKHLYAIKISKSLLKDQFVINEWLEKWV